MFGDILHSIFKNKKKPDVVERDNVISNIVKIKHLTFFNKIMFFLRRKSTATV